MLNDNGVQVDYIDLTVMTTKSIINMCNTNQELDNDKTLNMFYKDGGDTAGSQSTWNSKSIITASDHMFQYRLVPLCLEKEGRLVWLNPVPNSPSSTRPLFLIRGHEDDPKLLDIVIPQTDIPRDFLNKSEMNIEGANGRIHSVQYFITNSMKDLKFKKKLSGLGGADCILCDSQKKDWKDVDLIIEGFPINRSSDDTLVLYKQLIEAGDGEIIRKAGDFRERKGLNNKPLSSSSHSFLHKCFRLVSKINL